VQALLVLGVGCSGSGEKPCAPGQQIECACPGGAKGAQQCRADGSGYGECTGCPGTTTGTGGTGGATSSTGTGGHGGCAADTNTDVLNCGACGHACSTANGIPLCTGGVCQIACAAGFDDCNHDAGDGCEVNLKEDPAHCGTCDNACPALHTMPTCSAGACGIGSCSPGWADCNMTLGDGCEIDLTADPFNCGTCKKSCQGGGCNASACGAPPTVLASVPATASLGVAVDATSVYWTTTTGDVNKVPIGGGAKTQLASTQGYGVGIAVDATHVYYASGSTVSKVPIGGGPSVLLASSQNQSWSIAIDATDVYWVNRLPCSVSRVPKAGGAVTVLANPGGVCQSGMAIDAGNVYWASLTDVMSVPKAGGATTTLATNQNPGGIAADGTSVYWTTGDKVVRAPVGGGTPVTLSSMQSNAMAITVDAGSVYWIDYGRGNVMKVAKGGGTPFMLASIQSSPSAIVVDATRAYWVLASNLQVLATPK
jgi:hypothetical protein